MKKIITFFPTVTAYFLILLFCYASASKIFDFENFQIQIAQSPLLSAYAGFVSYATIISEMVIVLLLLIPKSRLIGLYASLGIMSAFTIYIYLILNYSDFVPCSCGGILEKLGWTEHLIFNILCVIAAIVAIVVYEIKKEISPLKYTFLIFTTVITASVLVVILFYSSEKIIRNENNFTRRFLINPIIEKKLITLKNSNYYFAGIDKSSVYLGNREYPLELLTVNNRLDPSNPLIIHLDNSNAEYKRLRLIVRYPNYYLYDGTVPIILYGKVGDQNARTISLNSAFFSQLETEDHLNFILRTQSSQNKQFVLAQLNLNQASTPKIFPEILEKQIDGVFDSDGILLTDKVTKRFIYLYYYRNQFIVMNDSLNNIKRINTIDTVKTAQIKVTKLSDGRHKMNAPALKVNRNASAYKNLLFNQSNLIGKHESREDWKNASVIDIYRTDEQHYIGSFYIFKKDKRPVSDFVVTDEYLYVIMGNQLMQYQLTKSITKYFESGEAENLSKE